MIFIKLFVLVTIILLITKFILSSYLANNLQDLIRSSLGIGPWYIIAWGLLFYVDVILLIASVIYLLFIKF